MAAYTYKIQVKAGERWHDVVSTTSRLWCEGYLAGVARAPGPRPAHRIVRHRYHDNEWVEVENAPAIDRLHIGQVVGTPGTEPSWAAVELELRALAAAQRHLPEKKRRRDFIRALDILDAAKEALAATFEPHDEESP